MFAIHLSCFHALPASIARRGNSPNFLNNFCRSDQWHLMALHVRSAKVVTRRFEISAGVTSRGPDPWPGHAMHSEVTPPSNQYEASSALACHQAVDHQPIWQPNQCHRPSTTMSCDGELGIVKDHGVSPTRSRGSHKIVCLLDTWWRWSINPSSVATNLIIFNPPNQWYPVTMKHKGSDHRNPGTKGFKVGAKTTIITAKDHAREPKRVNDVHILFLGPPCSSC